MTDELCGWPTTSDGECQNPAGDDGTCWIPTHGDEDGENPHGRPSKFEDVREDLIEAADGYLNHRQVANKGGVSKSTLYEYLGEHDDFSDAFKRARARAAERLVADALDPQSEIDISFARFLLERSFQFIKTEKREVEHSTDGPMSFTIDWVADGDDGDE
jgi:hypothetical protein